MVKYLKKKLIILRDFVQKGFVVVENMIDDDLIDAVNNEIDDAVAKGYQGYQGYKQGSSQPLGAYA